MLNVPVNNFAVMLGRSHRFLDITSTFGGLICLAQGHKLGSNWYICLYYLLFLLKVMTGFVITMIYKFSFQIMRKMEIYHIK